MLAAVHTKYGSPEVVQIKDVHIPNPKQGEVLIKVTASTVNRTDSGFRSAEYFVSRFWSRLFKPRIQVLGCTYSGVAESIGRGVTRFKPGDVVFGFNDQQFGGHAEFTTQKAEGPGSFGSNKYFVGRSRCYCGRG
jgi:NADPH:quinone reductase-like Zn-dependent oxidoreductase